MGDINQQVRHYNTCLCFSFLRLLLELYKIMVSKRSPPRFVTYLVKEVIVCSQNFGLNSSFGFFIINLSCNAMPVCTSSLRPKCSIRICSSGYIILIRNPNPNPRTNPNPKTNPKPNPKPNQITPFQK
jgi:hypothetical protein